MNLEKQNMSLRHRIFLLLLAVGLASFIIAGAVSLAGMYAIRENIDKTGALLADNTASFTENFAEMQVKRRLSALNWLLRSRAPFHTRTAVKELKKLHMAE